MERYEPLLEVEDEKEEAKRRISPFFIDFFLSKVDIIDVAKSLGLKIHYKYKYNYFCSCPIHEEKTPSFCISQGKQMYKCYGCGKAGNVIHLVMETENINFIQAVFYIKKVCGIKAKIHFENTSRRKVVSFSCDVNKTGGVFLDEKQNILERVIYFSSDVFKSEEIFKEKQNILQSDDYYLRYLDQCREKY